MEYCSACTATWMNLKSTESTVLSGKHQKQNTAYHMISFI